MRCYAHESVLIPPPCRDCHKTTYGHTFMRGDHVAYQPHSNHVERGVVTRVTSEWVFVRYGTDEGSKATSHRDLVRIGVTR